MGILSEVFAWWTGATWGTRFTIWKQGEYVGSDELGNRYFEQRSGVGPQGKPRRWVMYKSESEPTLIPPAWHGWMHYTHDDPPTSETYVARPWEKPHRPNMTGTPEAYRPSGSILTSAERPRATGDYKPWQPS
jgi:NADH:ubiquinone oxidoreductase subunit